MLLAQFASKPHSYKSNTGMIKELDVSGFDTPSSFVIRIVPCPSRIFLLQGSSLVVAYSSPLYSSLFSYPQAEPGNNVIKKCQVNKIVLMVLQKKVNGPYKHFIQLADIDPSNTSWTTSPNYIIFPVCSFRAV